MRPGGQTCLAQPDVLHFTSSPRKVKSQVSSVVTTADATLTRLAASAVPEPITAAFDVDRHGMVTTADVNLVRTNCTGPSTVVYPLVW